ncbi:MAG: ribonuclease Z [Candidatus Cyclobacteriaceae bacterium M2_1C_046]
MSFKVTIFGSNSALPAYGRNHSAQLVQIEDLHCLMDCGEGTQLQLASQKGKFQKIEHIFISHLHGDHYLGLMGLLYSMNLNRRTKPVHIYSHRGLDDIITVQLRHSKTQLHYDIIFHALEEAGMVFQNDKVEVSYFPLKHRIPCSGFRFQEKKKPLRINKEKLPEDIKLQYIVLLKQGKDIYEDGNLLYKHEDYTLPPRRSRSYAYCSDTAYDKAIIPFIKDVDLLYHESTFLTKHEERAVHTYHSTAAQAAKIAKEANVGQLVLGHYSARYREIQPFLEEAKLIFPNSKLAIERESIEIYD